MQDEESHNKKIAEEIKKELQRTLKWMETQRFDTDQMADFVRELMSTPTNKISRRIFVTGVGRSGKVAESFAMRLSQLGFETRVLGEPTAPPVEKGDLFIVISGGGEHQIEETRIARTIGAKIVSITSHLDSTLGRLGDITLVIPGRSKEDAFSSSYEERRMRGIPVMPLGTAFEDLTMIFLDSIIGYLCAVQKKTEDELKKRHANPVR